MKRTKILFIGRLSFDNTPCAGEVVKNQLFFERVKSLYNNVKSVNLTPLIGRVKKPILIFKILVYILSGVDYVIISTYDELAADIISYMKSFCKRSKIFYWVIGGGIAKKIAKRELSIDIYRDLSQIIVEDVDIENDLKQLGITQVRTLPNFKPVYPVRAKEKAKTNCFLYLARITPLKGTDIILSAARMLNRKGLSYTIDFYGFIEKGYPFEEYVHDVPNVSYKGTISLKTKEDYENLYNKYDALLFPTFYPNEGFPGTIIDGFMAGLPVVTTQWRYNRHIVDDNKSGWLIPIQDAEKLANLMENILSGKYELVECEFQTFQAV